MPKGKLVTDAQSSCRDFASFVTQQQTRLYKQVNDVVLDSAMVTDTTSAEIGRQPVEIVDTPAAVVSTILSNDHCWGWITKDYGCQSQCPGCNGQHCDFDAQSRNNHERNGCSYDCGGNSSDRNSESPCCGRRWALCQELPWPLLHMMRWLPGDHGLGHGCNG